MTPMAELPTLDPAHPDQRNVEMDTTRAVSASQPLDSVEIMNTLPHRYPFLLVDRVLEIIPGKRIRALKNVSFNEPYFQGHFPGLPIMPGVLQIEALAQAGAFVIREFLQQGDKMAVLTGIDNFRFRRMVKPGDQLILEGEILKLRGQIGKGHFRASVDGEEVASGDILFSFIDRDPAMSPN